MKTLMMTTALVAATAFGAAAQTDTMGDTGAADQNVPAFLSSDFTGMTLYTLEGGAADQAQTDDMTAADRDRMRWTSSDRFLADRDNWESVGSIDDIVMTQDGEIRGVLVDVGGFLGFGARTVMVDIEELYFVADDADADSVDDFYVVIGMSEEQLENLPEWDEDQLQAGFQMRDRGGRDDDMAAQQDTAATDQQDMAATDQQDTTATDDMAATDDQDTAATDQDTTTTVTGDTTDEGRTQMQAEDQTADRLMGADVYDANGDNVGTVEDVVLADDRVTEVIVDVGGFLGMGTHTVALPIDDANITWSDQDDDVRVEVNMTADQMEEMPEYDG